MLNPYTKPLTTTIRSKDLMELAKEAETSVAIMDNLLYKAAVHGFKNLPTSIADDNYIEDECDICDEWRNLTVDEEYYTRKTRGKHNILHLSVQLEHFMFAEKAATRFPQLISEVNDYKNNSLHIAARSGDVDFVDVLVSLYRENIRNEKCQPWMGKNKDGNTPLHIALIYGKIELACYLVNLDPSLARVCNHSQEAPLHLALRHRVDNNLELVRSVMKEVNDKKQACSKPTKCFKIETNSLPIIKLLVKMDPFVTYWQDNKGLTPPLIAATLNPCYIQALEIMLKHCPGCIEQTDYFGNTILHLMNKLPIITHNFYIRDPTITLIRFPPLSALINEQNNDGDTPAHIAIRNHNIELTAILIKCSAALTIKNKNGISAADLIQQSSDKFRTLVKDKVKEIGIQMLTNAHSNYVSTESVMEIGLSFEKLMEAKMLDKITEHGNILHTLLHECPTNMGDDEVKELVTQALEMAPSLICELNNKGQTPLHLIAQQRPFLIDQVFRQQIQSCYEQVTVYDDAMEGLLYDTPWKVKDEDRNTILHLALSNNLPDSFVHEILQFDLDLADQVNEKGEFPLHVMMRTGWHVNDGNKSEHIRNCDLKTTYDEDLDGNTIWHNIADVKVSNDCYDATSTEYVWTNSCLRACSALTQTNKSGKTPFHLAIENDNFEIATMFSKALQGDEWREWKLPHLVYNDMADKEGNVPLHLVVGRCELPNARQFIELVTTSIEVIRVQNNMGMTPLHLAVHKQDIKFLNIIFNVKRDDKAFTRQILQIADTDNNTSLHYAISQGALEFVDMFFEEGISAECIEKILDMSNKDGNTPLHLAVLEGYPSLATKFIGIIPKDKNFVPRFLCKPNKEGNTALHLTVLESNQDIAEIFMKTANKEKCIKEILEKCNDEGNTPLHLAIHNRDFNLIKCFIEYAIEDSCIAEILDSPNRKDETPANLIGSAEHLPNKFEKFFWNEPKVVQAMLGVRSLSGVPTKMIKEYTNTIGVIAALLATITFTAAFAVPGGLDSNTGTPLLMQKPSFQVFMVSDIIAMCLSMMVLFFLMWIMTVNDEKHQVILLDLTVLSLQGAFYATILTFMTGLYASVFRSTHWIAIFTCVICSLLILLMHKRLIILFIPGFIHIYIWYQNMKKICGRMTCFRFNKNRNNEESSKNSGHANELTGDSPYLLEICRHN